MKRKLMTLIGIMLVISIAASALISLFGNNGIASTEGKDKLQVMTTFYPIYMIGQNLADGIDDIEIKNLTDLNTGCLHDYQLTTEDMKNISESDLLIVNGGGMEGFLSDVRENYPGLDIIDASNGITMLPTGNGAGENDNYNSGITTSDAPVGAEQKEGAWNAHVWLDPELYIRQIENVRDGILAYIEMDRPNSKELEQSIRANAQAYIDQVTKVSSEITDYSKKYTSDTLNQSKSSRKVIIFHDSFAYLANRIGMSVAYSVPLDSDTSLSAGEIAEIVQEAKKDQIRYLFTEEQFSDSIAKQIAEETGAKVYIIDSAVTGDGVKDSYLRAMEANLAVIENAEAGGQ